ncbi:hypothetical protein IWZ03DRAFT_123721 [Phyllosticta citriasiana]|uniref:Uncharacterized protein n=1 Tax=Phyllosticta citriasiana TaxID=595635 RepID=A0ABR1KCZ5_9PEZI
MQVAWKCLDGAWWPRNCKHHVQDTRTLFEAKSFFHIVQERASQVELEKSLLHVTGRKSSALYDLKVPPVVVVAFFFSSSSASKVFRTSTMAPKQVFSFKDTAHTSSAKHHRQRSAAPNPMMMQEPRPHEHVHNPMMVSYPNLHYAGISPTTPPNRHSSAASRPMRMAQEESDDDDEPLSVPQISGRRAAAAAAAPAPQSQQWLPAMPGSMPTYGEASPSGTLQMQQQQQQQQQQTHLRTLRDNYRAARDGEQAGFDELLQLYSRLRASKKGGDGAAIHAMDTSVRRLQEVYLMFARRKLEAYHELQMAKY